MRRLAWLALVALVLLAYAGSLNAPFVYDDKVEILATQAGRNLTHDSFREAAESLPQFKLPLAPYASLGAGKVDADDSARLSIYVEDDVDGHLELVRSDKPGLLDNLLRRLLQRDTADHKATTAVGVHTEWNDGSISSEALHIIKIHAKFVGHDL